MNESCDPVLVVGATGYIGRRLVPALVAAGHHVRCLARNPSKLDAEPWRAEVEVVTGDLLEPDSLPAAFAGIATGYYLVHFIGTTREWEQRDRAAAAAFRDAAAEAGVRQIIYLGGLGQDAPDALSPHLASRHEVGRVLAEGPVPVSELRAAVIIGSGSASFEMLRHLVEVLPVMITPRWVRTQVEPIAVGDVLHYLVGVLGTPEACGRVLEIGGREVVTYRGMMDLYGEVAGLRRRRTVSVPVLSPRLSSLWIGLVTPVPPRLARPLVDSLVNEVVVHDRSIDAIVPLEAIGVRDAIAAALRRVGDLEVTGSGDRSPADPIPSDPQWSGGTILADERAVESRASPAALYREVCTLGGARGWLVGNLLWMVRGAIDRLVGGPGLRRGRRHPTELAVGDEVDCWRVETLAPGRLVRLRAEMRLPGDAWLEWEIVPTGGRARLVQRARFRPRGLLGRAYWYAVAPFHALVFGRLARRLAADAEAHPDDRDV